MKQPGADLALLTPDAAGWRLSRAGAPVQKSATLVEAAALLPAGLRLHLALPCQSVLLERMRLPATDRDELAGMVQLQLEKTLPFPIDEVSSDFVVTQTAENESTLVSATAQHAQLDALCEPLREKDRLPEKITPFAMHVAAACPQEDTVLAVYPEQGQLVAAICEKGKLAWTHVLPSMDAAALTGELPQMLLSAEMEGAPTAFASVRLDNECAHLGASLREFFHLPVMPLALDGVLPEPAVNLVPSTWRADVERMERSARMRQWITIAGAAYVLAIVGAFAYLAWLKSDVRKIDAKYNAAKPVLEFVRGRQARWNTLAPAIDPHRFTVELLFQLDKNLPGEDVRITEFEQVLSQWKVIGEAPNANAAINYVTKLKEEKELGAYQISAGPPQIISANESAQFSIFGKL
jgi:hypothetical protein